MKGLEFISLIRKVIREEVRTAIKEELKSLKPIIAENATKSVKPKTPPPPQTQQRQIQRTTPLVTLEGPLGDILRETAESLHTNGNYVNESYGETEDWPDMNNGASYGSDDVPMTMMSQIEPTNQRQSSMSSFDADPTAMFVKDYSGVMKAADAHQGKI
jgi:hypothetical protein